MSAQPPQDGRPRKKKRVHPARKIVPRGRMGIQWIIGPLVMAAVILVLGIIFLLTHGR
jgi:hypothetical protein